MGCLIHKWDGCVCKVCGKTRHKWIPYNDVLSWGSHDDRQCKRCGTIEMIDRVAQDSSNQYDPCEGCILEGGCHEDDPYTCPRNRD